jgi:predicted dehydrogenase
MNRSTPIGYGIIGAGIWGELHTRVLSKDPRVKVNAICDLNEKRGKEIADKYGIQKVYRDYNEMLLDPSIEAVSIATPDFAHGEPAIAVVSAGKHLLVEKPMATTVEESLKILAGAKKTGVTLMVDFHNRWSPSFYNAYESLKSGEMGKLEFMYFRLSDTTYVPEHYITWAAKSSVLWFLGPHAVDTVRWLFNDEVREVFAVSRKGTLTSMGIDTPDFYTMILQFENGGVAHLEHSWIVSPSSPSIFDLKSELQASKGTIFIDTSHNTMLQKYTQSTPLGYPYTAHQDTTLMPIIHNQQVGFATESIRHFVECLWEGKQPIVGGVDGLRTTEILAAAEQSALTNLPVKVNRTNI